MNVTRAIALPTRLLVAQVTAHHRHRRQQRRVVGVKHADATGVRRRTVETELRLIVRLLLLLLLLM
jgi:hypothetical protein